MVSKSPVVSLPNGLNDLWMGVTRTITNHLLTGMILQVVWPYLQWGNSLSHRPCPRWWWRDATASHSSVLYNTPWIFFKHTWTGKNPNNQNFWTTKTNSPTIRYNPTNNFSNELNITQPTKVQFGIFWHANICIHSGIAFPTPKAHRFCYLQLYQGSINTILDEEKRYPPGN